MIKHLIPARIWGVEKTLLESEEKINPE